MDGAEIVSMIVALVLMFGSIGAKVITSQLLERMRRQISQVESVKQESMNRLKVVQRQKEITEANKTNLAGKKARLTKRFKRVKKEMSEIEQEEDARKKRQDSRQDLRKVD